MAQTARPALETTVVVLPNGLRVATTPIPHAESVSICLYAGVGSRFEESHRNGISHFLEHMLFKGSEKRPSAAIIAETIEGAGGSINAFTAKEVTSVVVRLPCEKLELGLDVVADMVAHPIISDEEVARERQVVLEEIKRSRDIPSSWVGQLASLAAYGDQPIGWPVIGRQETVEGLSRDDLELHLRRWYTPNNMVLSVSGRTTPDEVAALAEAMMGPWKARETDAFRPAMKRGDGPHAIVEKRTMAQANLVVSVQAIPRDDPDRFPAGVLNGILGRGMSSRLFREVRERRGLAYSVGSGLSRHHDVGLLSAHVGVAAGKTLETLRVVLQECARLREELVSEEELSRAKEHAVGSFRLGLESTAAVARFVGDALINLGRVETMDEVVEGILSVTAEEVARVARRIFADEGLSAASVGPHEEADELERALHF